MYNLARWAQVPKAREETVKQAAGCLMLGGKAQRLHQTSDRTMRVAAFRQRRGLNESGRRRRLA